MGLNSRLDSAAHDCRSVRKSPGQLRVVSGAVVTLAIVFPDQFPVTLLDNRGLERYASVGQLMRQQVGLDLFAGGCEVRSIGSQADEDVARDSLTVDAPQTELTSIECRSHLAGCEQGTVQIVGPL